MAFVTEPEARKRWCPFARILAGSGGGNRNSDDRPTSHCKCMASTCMAWVEARPAGEGLEALGVCGLVYRESLNLAL